MRFRASLRSALATTAMSHGRCAAVKRLPSPKNFPLVEVPASRFNEADVQARRCRWCIAIIRRRRREADKRRRHCISLPSIASFSSFFSMEKVSENHLWAEVTTTIICSDVPTPLSFAESTRREFSGTWPNRVEL